jgi:hypothetical protein
MTELRTEHPIIHFVGSIPLPDAEAVFRTLAQSAGAYLRRLPDGETGIRKTWIRFLQQMLADNPAIEVAADVPHFKFTQWDGKLLREIPRLRVKPGAKPDSETFETGYAEMAIASWSLFEQLQTAGVIPATVKFQISLPTPIAPTYNNMVPSDRPLLLPALTRHLTGEVAKIAAVIPNDRIAVQWDVCQEVLAWEGYYEKGPVDFRTETIDVLTRTATPCLKGSNSVTTCVTAARRTSIASSPRTWRSWSRLPMRPAPASCARSNSFTCRFPRGAPMMPISPLSTICICSRRPSSISVSSITMIPRATRRGLRQPGAIPGLAVLQPSAAWHGATRHGWHHCLPRMSAQRRPSVWDSARETGQPRPQRSIHSWRPGRVTTAGNKIQISARTASPSFRSTPGTEKMPPR